MASHPSLEKDTNNVYKKEMCGSQKPLVSNVFLFLLLCDIARVCNVAGSNLRFLNCNVLGQT